MMPQQPDIASETVRLPSLWQPTSLWPAGCDTRDVTTGKSTRKHYSKSPVTEALIDIRVAPLPENRLKKLATLPRMLKREYPVKRTRMEVSTEISAGPHLATSAQQRPTGTLFIGRDERQIAQFRLDGFTFSRLAPYPEWESVREEALRLWRAYRVLAPDARVTRVAVRYVNRLKLPLPVGDLGDYLTLRPELPSEVGGISGFFVHLEIPQPDISAMLIINEAIAEPPTEQRLAVLLDFDLFRDTALPGNDEAVWATLDGLHQRVDDVFEQSLTERAKELIT